MKNSDFFRDFSSFVNFKSDDYLIPLPVDQDW